MGVDEGGVRTHPVMTKPTPSMDRKPNFFFSSALWPKGLSRTSVLLVISRPILVQGVTRERGKTCSAGLVWRTLREQRSAGFCWWARLVSLTAGERKG